MTDPPNNQSSVFFSADAIHGMIDDAELLAEALIDTVLDVLLVLDAGLRVRFANRYFYQTFCCGPQETLGTLVYELGNRQWDIPALRTLLEEVLPGNSHFDGYEVSHDFPVIGRKVMKLNARNVRRRDGQEPLILLAMIDVTEEGRAADSLRHSEQRYRTLVTAAQEGIWTIDESGRTTFANPSMAEMLGTTPERMLGKPSFDFVFPEDVGRATELFRQKIDGDRRPFDFRLRRADGSAIWASISGVALYDNQGRATGLLGTFRDITERKLAEEAVMQHANELARANADLQHFAYITSHDLREPLRTMKSYAQLLKRRYERGLGEDADVFLDFISTGADRMQSLIDDLGSYSKTIARNGDIARPVKLNDAVKWARQNLQVAIEEAGANVEHGELPTICGDELQIVQLFQNLLSNAVKYRRPDAPPKITIEAERTRQEWIIAVRDNGIGIPPEHWEKIFGVFQRLHGREVPGTGVGLAICKKIADNHNGRIWIESEPGNGSTFYVALPDFVNKNEQPVSSADSFGTSRAPDTVHAVDHQSAQEKTP